MKPFGREKKIKGSGIWKQDYHLHRKNKKLGNWWEDMSTIISRSTMKQKVKKEQLTVQKINNMNNKWISVEKNLPKEGGRYWCYLEHQTDLGLSHFQWNCSYNEVSKTFSDRYLTDGEKVTHWQPLPNPPDEEDEDMLEEAKKLWQNGNKLEAVKLMCQHGYRLKDAKNYCDKNFGKPKVKENELHPDTENLLKVCFEELRLKLIKNQEKYGYSNEWLTLDWEQECREEMMKHIQKGDPRDVAIYAMFMIYRGCATSVKEKEELIIEVRGKEGLEEKFKTELNSTKHWNSVNDFDVDAAAKQCAQIAKQYSNSKLEELEKLVSDAGFLLSSADEHNLSDELRTGISKWMEDFYKFQSLKQES
jgi:hypothetical protein